jgi:hypothetical protein
VGTIGWLIIVAAIGAWELFAHLARNPRYPNFGRILRPFLETQLGRVAMYGLWVFIGVHFFVRHH